MTQEHLTPEQIQRFALPTRAPDAERTRANAHIESCLQCRLAFEAALDPLAPALLNDLWHGRDAEAEECLDAKIIARYAQGEAGSVEADIVEMHIETCESCRSEVAAQEAGYKRLAVAALQTAQTASLAAKQPAQEVKVAANALPAPVARRGAWPATPHFKWRLAFGGSALAAAACGVLLWLHPNSSRQPHSSSDAGTTASNAIPLAPKTGQTRRADSPNPAEQRLASLARRGGRTMGGMGAGTIALIAPDGVLVSSLRPTFRWKAVSRAAAYRLTCIPQIGKDSRNKDGIRGNAGVIPYTVPADAGAGGADVAWTIPATQPALQPAVKYTWIVQALDADNRQAARSSTHEVLFFLTPAAPPAAAP